MYIVWCTVELEYKDGKKKEFFVLSRHLEKENGEKVSRKDLFFGSVLIWMHKKLPYEVTVLETHSML